VALRLLKNTESGFETTHLSRRVNAKRLLRPANRRTDTGTEMQAVSRRVVGGAHCCTSGEPLKRRTIVNTGVTREQNGALNKRCQAQMADAAT